jgi:putative transposase
LSPEEEEKVLDGATASPDISCQQLAYRLTGSGTMYVSESTVYRILKREGLIRAAEIIGFTAAKGYQGKTKQPNELWVSDWCHLRVVDCGWYYLVTVVDDFSRFILGWELKVDITGGSLEDVVEQQ